MDGLSATLLGVATIFCRVGGVFMVAPGLSSSHTPMQVRLFLALGLSLAVSPLLLPQAVAAVGAAGPADLLGVMGSETLVGLMIGFLSRLLLLALQFIAIAIANAVGLAGIPGVAMEEGESGLPVATLFTATATTIIFAADLHYEVFRAVIGSYDVVAPGAGLDVRQALVSVTDRFADVFLVALRLGAPFLIYSVIVNFAVGITNKLTPSLPVFFVATPFVAAGGLLLATIAIREVMIAFTDAFDQLSGAL